MANVLSRHNLKVRIARSLGQWGSDALAFALAYVLTGQSSPARFLALFGLWSFWAGIKRSYTGRIPFWTQLFQLLKWSLGITLLSLTARVLAQDWAAFSSTVTFGACLMVLVPIGRWVMRVLLVKLGLWNRKAIIFGAQENAYQSWMALNSEPSLGYEVQGFVKPLSLEASERIVELAEAKGLAIHSWRFDTQTLQHIALDACIVALEATQADLRDLLLNKLSAVKARTVMVIPAMRGVPLFGLSSTQFFSHEVLMLHVHNQLAKPMLRGLKRLFDLVGSAVLLLLLSPLFVFVAYKVSRDGGSAFFGHERVGKNGQKFKCYKFRSMVVNAEEVLKDLLERDPVARAEWEKDFKLKNDPRINPIGYFLRRTSLDELPQLWNVLVGDMSLVGPRPVVQAELERYGNDLVYYLMAKPGMTGLWQVSGRNDVDYETRVYFDTWYVKNWSLWTDIAILFKTISVVMGREGAY
jgi:Undecaprenyl-phosphate galactose phosphotransferase WbaP